MPFVSITRLRVRRWRYLPGFLLYALASTLQARRASGNLAVSVLNDADFAFWTRSMWTDEAAMRAFAFPPGASSGSKFRRRERAAWHLYRRRVAKYAAIDRAHAQNTAVPGCPVVLPRSS